MEWKDKDRRNLFCLFTNKTVRRQLQLCSLDSKADWPKISVWDHLSTQKSTINKVIKKILLKSENNSIQFPNYCEILKRDRLLIQSFGLPTDFCRVQIRQSTRSAIHLKSYLRRWSFQFLLFWQMTTFTTIFEICTLFLDIRTFSFWIVNCSKNNREVFQKFLELF